MIVHEELTQMLLFQNMITYAEKVRCNGLDSDGISNVSIARRFFQCMSDRSDNSTDKIFFCVYRHWLLINVSKLYY